MIARSSHLRGAPNGVLPPNPIDGAPNVGAGEPNPPPIEEEPKGEGLGACANEPKDDVPCALDIPDPKVMPDPAVLVEPNPICDG